MRLEVDITGKTFRNAAGEQHDVLAGSTSRFDAGEVGVLVGPSGCGKSTMLRILAGLDHDFQGRVVAPGAGADRHGVSGAAAAAVALGRRQCAACRARWSMRRSFPRCSTILELNAHRSHFPGELSLGLARRVALARAFAVEPDFLILDEPLASLDDALAAPPARADRDPGRTAAP